MLFSSREVADFINATFEPAWETVRPAPLVTIDFGNGRTVKRTLQGNIATYVCGPDGTVYDVLPGIYAPDVYREQLEAIEVFAASLQPRAGTTLSATAVADKLNAYHSQQSRLLRAAPQPTPQMQAIAQTGGGFNGGGIAGIAGGNFGQFGNLGGQFGLKGGIERPLQRMVAGQVPTRAPAGAPQSSELKLDSEVNERIRRKDVHDKLAVSGRVQPNELKKWLYKNVLHADLDDPMLGLEDMLNASYPFAEEDRAAGR